MSRKILGRNLLTDYITLEGLERLTAEAPEEWDWWIITELIDNALDICDENNIAPSIQIKVKSYLGDRTSCIYVVSVYFQRWFDQTVHRKKKKHQEFPFGRRTVRTPDAGKG